MNFCTIIILLTLGALSIAKSSVFASVVAPIGLAPRFVPPNVLPFADSVATVTRALYPYGSGIIPVSRILPSPLLPQTPITAPIVAPAIPHVASPPITPFTAVVPEAVPPSLVPAPVPFEARSIHAVAPAVYPALPPAFPPVASSLGR